MKNLFCFACGKEIMVDEDFSAVHFKSGNFLGCEKCMYDNEEKIRGIFK